MCSLQLLQNHISDRGDAKIIGTEDNKHPLWMKEATEIQKCWSGTVNQDYRAFLLLHTKSAVLKSQTAYGAIVQPPLTGKHHVSNITRKTAGSEQSKPHWSDRK